MLDNDFHLILSSGGEIVELTEEEREGVVSNVSRSFNLDVDGEGIFFLIESEVVINWEVI